MATLQIRRGTSTTYTTNNPTLAAGEMVYEKDTRKMKIGDGTTAWNSLPYMDLGFTSTTTGKFLDSFIPSLALEDAFSVASEQEMLGLGVPSGARTRIAEHGDIAFRTDENKTYMLIGDDPSVLQNWQEWAIPAITGIDGGDDDPVEP